MATLTFKIVTPQGVAYASDVDQVSIPTQLGQITILPHHLPLISVVQSGELIAKKGEVSIPMAISDGIVQVQDNVVTVLATTAERAESIDQDRAVAAHQRAEQALRDAQNREDVNYTDLASKMEKELARLRVVRKHHHGRPPTQPNGSV